ncbi:Outer membrane lipoprotein-sorting protein [Devosia enhydra]|uniref:Outer membrane lipoprotein-sorting protein n=1 Tax=Devosia enhydra TaxID=665118 RepID=A0A1K2HYS5_9HYPH|nr:outer membrane lipoprotein carrier protein LolA [Devosia enhydra]SFZ85221.1 Outer membrane lipoprotein-sorting protein [Devosia enhydra]
MKRRDLLAFAAAFTLLPATAMAQPSIPLAAEDVGTINDISAHNSAIRTMAGRFLQIDTRGDRIEGTFFIERPGKVRFRYNPPSREEIISVGRGFYVINRQEETQYAYPQDAIPLRSFLDSAINLMTTNIVAFDRSEGYVIVTLEDQTPAGLVRVSLVFDEASLDLKQWTLVEPSGAELTFSLYDVQKDVDIPANFFAWPATYKAVEPGSR